MKIEVSNGEIIDRHIILVLKKAKITDKKKLKHIEAELTILKDNVLKIPFILQDYIELSIVNSQLWEIEDKLRLCEQEERFDDYFIQLARQVYILNDQRAEIKKQINISTDSKLIEEKSY